ncbi:MULTISPECIES: helix-turn-helix domain-containing protein [Streptomyces]|uniref:PucR family transcriptional regulator n=1 Tax=Streptomyces spororaveus TaxID=284039 RepID=A0ABQ3TNG3_9ACTN|nr:MULTISPECIES: helix-turn-helix domain-containing protein [Streptomyces]MCM9077709.1 helix-turn-helix domain-containing protein [Streptomyces spororaveus]MCX5307811.1 helix-turn-helix domain-containing protein [Streptomyces sp. NBC_00160]GHI81946.1 PucR family transcriptional regulator [Streptomyces spororaveus]
MERIIEEIREDLSRRIAVAADRLADRTLTEDPAYAALLGRAELRERIHHDLRQAVEGLVHTSRGLPVELADARAVGALRAEQGLPLASVLRTYRRGGRLLWQSMTESVTAHDRAALPRLLPGAAALWDVLDRTTDAMTESYRRTEAAHGDRDRERRAALLDVLLDGADGADGASSVAGWAADGAAAPAAEAAAARLGLPERGRFTVVVLAPDASGNPVAPLTPVPPAGGTGAAAAPRVLWRTRADGEIGLVELGHHPLESVRELLAPLGVRAGVGPVVAAPAELARAHRLAALALRTSPGSEGPRTALLDERLPAALIAAQPELAGRLCQVVLGPVLALPAADRRTLLTTLGTWLACQGSTTDAAQRLYCHRNTVSNRLRRLEQLTGRSLSDPRHVVELALAHAAVLQRVGAEPATRPAAPDPRASRTPGGTARRSPRRPA